MVDAHGWYISAVFQDCRLFGCLEVGYIYICHSVGFCIVRLDDKGNARALDSEMGKGEIPTLSFYLA